MTAAGSFVRSLIVMASLVLTACAEPSLVRPTSVTEPHATDRSVLAAEWDYEDGAVVVLRLDEQGNGTYEWKDGRIETTDLRGRTWTGKWFQTENDREGGFLVEFSPDYTEGEGRWWYTRIGTDPAPPEKGGRFHLTKKTALAAQGPVTY
jgi:hypothetical protein